MLEQAFEQGNEQYAKGSYKAAASSYQKVVNAGYYSSDLYYNLGNAYYKQQQYAKAILSYERALKYAPSNSKIKNNLEMAKMHTRDKIEAVPAFFLTEWGLAIRNIFSANGWAWMSVVAFVLCGLFFLVYRFLGSLLVKKVTFTLSSLFLLVFFFSVWNASVKTEELKNPNAAIIMAPSAVVKSSPDQNGKDLFVLHDGAKVTFTSTLPVSGWREVRIADGKVGWVESNTFEVI